MVKIGFQRDSATRRLKNAGIGDLTHYLVDRGFENEEAGFLQDSVKRGSTLLVFEVEERDVPFVEELLSEAEVSMH